MTVQLELTPSALPARTHGEGGMLLEEPTGWLVKLKLTVPCGVVLVPESVSATLTVQVAGLLVFFFNDTATTEIYTLSLHDALPISLLAAWMEVALGV